MGQPTPYTPATNFADDESTNVGGRSTVRTDRVDGEFASIAVTLGEMLTNLALLQRDDGKVRDGLIELYNLSATALAALASDVNPRGDWATATEYDVGDLVETGGQSYLSLVEHISGVFATDKAAGKWMVFGAPVAASGVSFTPPASMVATTAQAAVEEVETNVETLRADYAAHLNGFRLSLTSGVPVTTSDVTGASFVYLVAYKHSTIGLYDTSLAKWRPVKLPASGVVAVLSTLTASKPHDIYIKRSSDTSTTTHLSEWTNATTRSEAQAYQDGVVVLASDASYRYLGTVYVDAAKQASDSLSKRHLFNNDNRVRRALSLNIAVASWTYTTATVRQANGSTSNQVQVMTGLAEDSVRVDLSMCAANSTGNVVVQCGIGVNSTTFFSGAAAKQTLFASTDEQQMQACVETVPAIGLNTFAALEYSAATGTTVWFGTGYGKNMVGSCLA